MQATTTVKLFTEYSKGLGLLTESESFSHTNFEEVFYSIIPRAMRIKNY